MDITSPPEYEKNFTALQEATFGNYRINGNAGTDAEAPISDATEAQDSPSPLEGDIVFRTGALRRPTIRSLYSGTPPLSSRRMSSLSNRSPSFSGSGDIHTKSTVFPDQVGMMGRKKSLVNPEEYIPGGPSGVSGGKAMAAGFDPVRPVSRPVSETIPLLFVRGRACPLTSE